MVRRSGSAAVFFFALVSVAAFGQAAVPSPPQTNQVAAASSAVAPVMPKDANVAMLLAARVNGLAGLDKPWHLKANYQTFDADGKPKDTGVFEEWWAGPTKYKVSYASTSFNQVQYRDGDKTWMVGDAKWPLMREGMVEQLFVHPLPPEKEVEGQKYVAKDVKDRATPLMCLHQETSPQVPVPGFCFTEDLPAVRYEEPYGGMVALFNQIVRVDGHSTAKQVRVQAGQEPFLSADLVTLELQPKIEDAEFAAPASAILAPVPPLETVPWEVIARNKISGEKPVYPSIASGQYVQGPVVLRARISTDGTVEDLTVLMSPPLLRRVTLDAVKTWKYKPYLVNGQPVEVETRVNVVFTLGIGGGIPEGRVN